MGQYHIVVNLDKKEYIETHAFNDGSKVGEFDQNSGGTLTALSMLLYGSDYDGGGYYQVFYKGDARKTMGGPAPPKNIPAGWMLLDRGNHALLMPEIAGRWAGDRVVVIGDYVPKDRWWKEAKLDRAKCAARWSKKKLADLKRQVKNPEKRAGSRMKTVGGRWVITDEWTPSETAEQAFERRKHYYAPEKCDLYDYATTYWKDVSPQCVEALKMLGMQRSKDKQGALRPDMVFTAGG